MMKRIILLIGFTVLPFYVIFSQQTTNFRSPLDIPLILSGNFGELRSDHFHSGIDIKTKGSSGQKVYAVESGYVSRINVQPGGYGNALYIDHPNGYTSVYGHLSEYNSEIEKFITDLQYKRESHALNIYLNPGEINITKGEIIALSGNSGSSAGPHLHFEIRKTSNQHPLNVLNFNFPVKDDIPPKFKRLVIYPVGDDARINNSTSKYIVDVLTNHDIFTTGKDKQINVYGKIGFGIEIYDYLNDSRNRCGIFSLELLIDGIRYYYSEMDEFSFSNSRFINAHIDYSLKKEKNYNIQRLYKMPYDDLSIYKYLHGNGKAEIRDTLIHKVEIIASDSYGNTSRLLFNIKGAGSTPQIAIKKKPEGIILPYNAASGFSDRDIHLTFPAYCFYDDVNFTFARTNSDDELLSDLFHIHNESIPVHRRFSIEITPGRIPPNHSDKICLVKIEEDELTFAGGTFNKGKVSANIRSFGTYAISIDTISPVIKPLNFYSGKDMSGLHQIKFTIEDNLSGIDEYKGYIDNQWVLFKYDPKKSLLYYEFDKWVPISKKNHELEIYLSDALGNKAVYHTVFYR